MVKKLPKWLLLTLLVIGAFAAGVQASDGIEKIEASLRSDFQMELNGDPVVLHDPPILYEGRTYLPVRSLAVLLGADITWFQHKKLISIQSAVWPGQQEGNEQVDGAETEDEDQTIVGVITNPEKPTPDQKPPETNKPKEPSQPNEPYEPSEPEEKDNSAGSESFRFHSLMQYEMRLYGKAYPVLANVTTNQTVYVRVSDLRPMALELSDVDVLVEEETGQLFVRFTDIRAQFSEEELVVYVLEEPVATSIPSDHMKELLEHGQDAHYIRPISGSGEYEMIYSTLEGTFYAWHVKVEEVGGRTYLSYQEKIDFYKELK